LYCWAAGAFVIAAIPFALVALFHSYAYHILDAATYLVFHNVSELFSVVVALSVFGLGWFAYSRSKDRHALFLSLAFLAVGLLDLMHTFTYRGMPAFFSYNNPNKATEFWIISRFFTAAAFLVSAFISFDPSDKHLYRYGWLSIALAIPALSFALVVLFPGILPDAYVDGIGLTPFKRASELVIIFLLAFAVFAYLKRLNATKDRRIILYLGSFILSILSEMAFTFYTSVYDTYNIIGHVYKVFAFTLIYQGVFVSSIIRPYEKLKQTLCEKESLVQELYHRTNNNLQMILSTLILQADKYTDNDSVKDLVAATETRIMAIKLVHEKLYMSHDLSRISIRLYTEDLIKELSNRYSGGNKRVVLSLKETIADETILVDTAIPFGLIINELLANSYKHAFPDGRQGNILIRLEKHAPDAIFLSYSDDGVGFPADANIHEYESLGMRLIIGLGESQMRGKITFDSSKGFACNFEFPRRLYKERV